LTRSAASVCLTVLAHPSLHRPIGSLKKTEQEHEPPPLGALFPSVAELALALPGCGGTMHFGCRNASNITGSTVRLNLPAANAVLGALGIAAITP
jgi:hypothetical protein